MDAQFPPSSPPDAGLRRKPGLLPAFMPSDDVALTPRRKGEPIRIHEDVAPSSPAMPTMPTPDPSSSLGIAHTAPSSPTRANYTGPRKMSFHPTFAPSAAQNRAFTIRSPLSTVALVRLPTSGRALTIGRSSQSCDVAVSRKNKLVSRVHARVSYDAHTSSVVVTCLGWNGLVVVVPSYATTDKAALQAQAARGGYPPADGQHEYEVFKDQGITVAYVPGITIDIRGDRALLELVDANSNDDTEDELLQAVRQPQSQPHHAAEPGTPALSLDAALPHAGSAPGSPVRAVHGAPTTVVDESVEAPEEPEERVELVEKLTAKSQPQQPTVLVPKPPTASIHEVETPRELSTGPTELPARSPSVPASSPTQSQPTQSEPTAAKPVQQLARNEDQREAVHEAQRQTPQPMSPSPAVATPVAPHKAAPHKTATPKAATPKSATPKSATPNSAKRRAGSEEPDKKTKRIKQEEHTDEPVYPEITLLASEVREIRHIVANHLAFSRLSQTPLSTLQKSVNPLSKVSRDQLRAVLASTPCVGIIERSGKDAAGKPLEEEYYYVPEHDDDEHRKLLLEQSRGHGGLRSCRRQHKQYYWKKPAAK